MRRGIRVLCAFFLLLSAVAPRAAEGAIDARRISSNPGATLLLPYFEVGLKKGPNTIIRFGVAGTNDPDFGNSNNGASASLARVTLWSNTGAPVFAFDNYFTGYDMQTIDLRQVLNGRLPLTADDGLDLADTADPRDGISNQGILSQDINFPSTLGIGADCPGHDGVVPAAQLAHMRAALTGRPSPLTNNCYCIGGNGKTAVGYITIDSMSTCDAGLPTGVGYFNSLDHRSILWGDFQITGSPGYSGAMVPLRSSTTDPLTSGVGKYTFYGRGVGFNTTDHRQPLPTKFAAQFRNTGGKRATSTTLFVWRDPKDTPNANGFPCGHAPDWFPLDEDDIVAFDERENPFDIVASPFNLATQKVRVDSRLLPIIPTSGWLYLDLNHQKRPGPAADVQSAQSWVTSTQTSKRGPTLPFPVTALDSAADPPTHNAILP